MTIYDLDEWEEKGEEMKRNLKPEKLRSIKEEMLKRALELWGEITPCSGLSMDECFTFFPDSIMLWVNVSPDRTTRTVSFNYAMDRVVCRGFDN
jgi:hypothetical protein